jgi:hypothetical protein
MSNNHELAFPSTYGVPHLGMSLRDYFAAHCQEDDRLVKCVRAMDDRTLELFALFPSIEREEHITEIEQVEYTDYLGMSSELQKVVARLMLEAKAIARVRYMQADAMLAERQRAMGGGE